MKFQNMTHNQLIIGLIGEMAAGKTTVADYLKKKHGAISFRFSDILADILDRIYIEKKRKNYQSLSTFLRTMYGDELLSQVIAQDVDKSDHHFIVIEGVRRFDDIVSFKKKPNFHLWMIDTKALIRFERLTTRKEKPDDQKKTWEQFQKDELEEAEQQISIIAKKTKTHIDNNTTRENLFTQVEEVLKQYGN